MAELFRTELDTYERDVAKRIGARSAYDARLELEAHLTADFQARLEMGIPPEAAGAQSLEALGDLRQVVKSEPQDLRPYALAAAPLLFLLAFVVQGLFISSPHAMFHGLSIGRPDMRVAVPSVVAILASLYAAGGESRPNLRPLLGGWFMAVSTTGIGMQLLGAHPESSAFPVLAVWLAGPSLIAYLLPFLLARWIHAERELPGALAMRLLAWPLGMFIVGHARFIPSAFGSAWSWIWPATGLLLLLGMLGRRRLDIATAAAATFLGVHANSGFQALFTEHVLSIVFQPRELLMFGMLVGVQGVALGLTRLLRSAPRVRLAR